MVLSEISAGEELLGLDGGFFEEFDGLCEVRADGFAGVALLGDDGIREAAAGDGGIVPDLGEFEVEFHELAGWDLTAALTAAFAEGLEVLEGGAEVAPGVGFLAFGGGGCPIAEMECEFAEAGGGEDVLDDGGGLGLAGGEWGEAEVFDEDACVLCGGFVREVDGHGAAVEELGEGVLLIGHVFLQGLGAGEDETAAGFVIDGAQELALEDWGEIRTRAAEEELVKLVDDEEALAGSE
jgi:hypothetical protein